MRMTPELLETFFGPSVENLDKIMPDSTFNFFRYIKFNNMFFFSIFHVIINYQFSIKILLFCKHYNFDVTLVVHQNYLKSSTKIQKQLLHLHPKNAELIGLLIRKIHSHCHSTSQPQAKESKKIQNNSNLIECLKTMD